MENTAILSSTSRKRGRPSKPYRTAWGEHIDGLRRKGDGRWVISATGKTYVEPDERLAVARFRHWQAENERQAVKLKGSGHSGRKGRGFRTTTTGIEAYKLDGTTAVDEADLWAYVREQLISRPEYVATMTGIAELSRLSDLPQREPSPTLQAVGDLHNSEADISSHHRRQQERFWADFREWMAEQGVVTLRQLTPKLVADYGQAAKKKTASAKYLKHRFTDIRSTINFARKRGLNADDCRHALDCCAVLTVSKANGCKNSHPIEKDDYQKLLTAANPRMTAALLIMLNLCMYPGEALALDWGDLDLENGTATTKRPKTGVIRIGVLWDRTIEALTAIKPSKTHSDAPVFVSREGSRLHIKTIGYQFRDLRASVGVSSTVKAEDLRDGAYTSAIESGADLTQAKLLAGHSTGISDHYAKRRPTMVADVCKAIERAYF